MGFFEAGLLGSYTIVTSEAPDVKGLIDSQIDSIMSLVNSNQVNNLLIKDPTIIQVTNKMDVADALKEQANVDGVSVDQMNVSTYQNLEGSNIEVNIEALGYSSVNVSSGQIVLSQTPDYQVVAKAKAKADGHGVEIDTSTIKITSVLKLYSTNKNASKIQIG
ncbi:hypothetical protein [Methanobrevibacter filiformis]|uniref:hypothetical protein n=1 Tax=Methanobrevibacter filiformis TaxID=55758 RepID=UPI001B80594B|nr:hypothetical protein [Methanobrevibacter filiformis]